MINCSRRFILIIIECMHRYNRDTVVDCVELGSLVYAPETLTGAVHAKPGDFSPS